MWNELRKSSTSWTDVKKPVYQGDGKSFRHVESNMTEMSNLFGETIFNNGYMEKNNGGEDLCVINVFFIIGTQMSRTQCSQLSQSKKKSNLGDICFFLLHLLCVKLDFDCLPWSVNKFNNVRKSDLHFKVQAWQAKNSTLPPKKIYLQLGHYPREPRGGGVQFTLYCIYHR